MDGLNLREPTCPWTAVNGSYFGSPANGFGGAVNNNEGTPYVLLRNSIQRLLSGFPDPKYSPYGFASYRAPNGVSDVASDGRAYGMVFSPQDTNDSALALQLEDMVRLPTITV